MCVYVYVYTHIYIYRSKIVTVQIPMYGKKQQEGTIY